MKAKAEAAAARYDALEQLASARREVLTDLDYRVYSNGLAEFPPDVVVEVCQALANEAPAAFEPKFPILGVIRQRCQQAEAERRRRAREARLALPAHDYGFTDKPATPEMLADVKRRLKAIAGRKRR